MGVAMWVWLWSLKLFSKSWSLWDTVQYLISERGCDPMCKGRYHRTPLHWACQNGRLDLVKYLIEDLEVDSSCQDVNDATPLHIAALCGQLSVVKLQVEDYMCDPGVRNKSGETPADVAWIKDHTHITSCLLSIENIVSSELLMFSLFAADYLTCTSLLFPLSLQLTCVEL